MKIILLSICFLFVSCQISFAENRFENLIDLLAESKKEAIDAYYELSKPNIEALPSLSKHIHDSRETNLEYTDIGKSIVYLNESKPHKKSVGDWCYFILINMIDSNKVDPPKYYGYFHQVYNKDFLLLFLKENNFTSLEELQLIAAQKAKEYYEFNLQIYKKRINALESKK